MKKSHVGLLCALFLTVATAASVAAATLGAGVFSDGAVLVLLPPGPPIVPISIPQRALYRPAGASSSIAIVTLDCVDEFPGIDEVPPHFFASGLSDTQTRYWIALPPTPPIYPPDPCRIATSAGITSVPPTSPNSSRTRGSSKRVATAVRAGSTRVPVSCTIPGYPRP